MLDPDHRVVDDRAVREGQESGDQDPRRREEDRDAEEAAEWQQPPAALRPDDATGLAHHRCYGPRRAGIGYRTAVDDSEDLRARIDAQIAERRAARRRSDDARSSRAKSDDDIDLFADDDTSGDAATEPPPRAPDPVRPWQQSAPAPDAPWVGRPSGRSAARSRRLRPSPARPQLRPRIPRRRTRCRSTRRGRGCRAGRTRGPVPCRSRPHASRRRRPTRCSKHSPPI